MIPLMNGVGHVGVLREPYDTVIAGAMRVSSERRADGRIIQMSPFIDGAGELISLEALRGAAPDTIRSSMQHDVEMGRAPEIDIAGPILRGGRAHGIATPAIEELVERVRARAAAAASGSREGSGRLCGLAWRRCGHRGTRPRRSSGSRR